MTIAHFLLARIAEDEAKAKAAINEIHRVDTKPGTPSYTTITEPLWVQQDAGGAHVAATGPRVLEEAAAKRRIVQYLGIDASEPLSELDTRGTSLDISVAADNVLRFLAMPYRDHADYNRDWYVESD
ncbi:hypothetical protein QE364_000793 [Nocardioides zeae]|uniref:Uncharacterized protein n=1 Tax=Nocardioides zeae TaxID=1457234 RepID=A0ACC6IEC0_9ACTN|nr:DUF6221 family protein [Nocardioides zeae]MDR6174296.1 hypothetical protein [Nocardioides zeae]MDR6209101.1 hypothetical protein [Nocardioides zeae]